ncbi:hypothetical protein [Herbiconiux sp. UC225_62]|uniref:hypothetical protein n=1 Tax=Herbiconiux sp. UC225_62 TaxID=3350168 RepID=UPI0036D39C73
MIEKIRKVYTAPFYLSMNFDNPDPEQLRRIASLGRDAELQEILWMLETSEWRSRRMGAWFSLVRPEPEVGTAVLASLRTADGYLTAPDLAVVAVRLLGTEALPAIIDYQERAAVVGHGRLGRTSVLIELLGGMEVRDRPTENDRDFIAKMISVAELIEAS